jgi:hypothetical protein
MKRLAIAVAAIALLTSPAAAQRTGDTPAANPNAPNATANNEPNDPMAVMDRGKVIARDPDPWIRNELMRHSHSSYPD